MKLAEPKRDDDFYAYHREPECAEIWRAMLDNMGGGWPLWLFAAADFLLLRYKEEGHDLDAELDRIQKWQAETIKCPKCGSRRVAPILYGMPALDEDMEAKLARKELFLGGCMVGEADPKYHCFSCNKDVGSPPLLMGKSGLEDYRETVSTIHFTANDLFDGNDEVVIKKAQSGITIKTIHGDEENEPITKSREISENEFRAIVDQLYRELYLHEWKRQYGDPNLENGDHWELTVRLTNNRVRRYVGKNSYPPYWKELKAVFKPYF